MSTWLVACGTDLDVGDGASSDTEQTSEALTGQDGALAVTTANTVLNDYAALNADVIAGATSFTVDDATTLNNVTFGNLAAGDLLLIVQMQGATIDSTDAVGYGAVTALGNAGRYEFVKVASIAVNTITIDTSCQTGLRYAYTSGAAGRTQVVRVPQLSSLAVSGSGSIVATAWNGTRGGIVAVHVGGTASIDGAGIDVSAQGFRGGVVDNSTSNGVTTYRSNAAGNGAEKGEGIAGDGARYDSTFNGRYSRGAAANGGGGGDGHNGGGGGGANGNSGATWTGQGVMDGAATGATAWTLDPGYIANGNALTTSSGGGRGGYTYSGSDQDALTIGPGNALWGGDSRREVGGLGGRPVANDPTGGRLFMGGGGGAGDGNNGAASAGGRGGGMVFLVANQVSGAGVVRANGASAVASNGNPGDAPGGGGAGGTIVLRTNALSDISVEANGGVGGNQTLAATNEAEGPGGGGGGGFIAVAGGAVARSATGGANGTTNRAVLSEFPANGATRGAAGEPNAAVTNIVMCSTVDLSIAITDSQTLLAPGDSTTYTITVTNTSTEPLPIFDAAVADTFPAGLTGVTWTCSATAGSACGAASGSGNLASTVTLAPGGIATYTVSATISASASGTLANTATVTAPSNVTDPSLGNNSATDNTTINRAPVASDDSITVDEDAAATAVPVLDNDSDFDNNSLTIIAVTQPSNGAAAITGGGTGLTITPQENYFGTMTFTYTIADGLGGQASATVTVTVSPVNDAPEITSLAPNPATEATGYTYTPARVDIDGPAQNWSVGAGDTCGGAVDAGTGEYTFTPAGPTPPASCTVSVQICDGGTPDLCDTQATVVSITATNDAPVITSTAPLAATEDAAYTYNPTRDDADGPAQNWSVGAGDTCGGAVDAGTGEYTFTPAGPTPPASCTVSVQICDGGTPDLCDTQATVISITATNDAPVITSIAPLAATEDAAYTYNPTRDDADGPAQTWTVGAGDTCGGAVDAGTGEYTFTPAGPTPPASCTVSVQICDGGTPDLCDTQATVISITAINSPPTLVDDNALATTAPVIIEVLANDSDVDGDTLTVTAVSVPNAGTAVINVDGTITYTPDGIFEGTVTFTYTVSDGNGGEATATVTVQTGADDDGDGLPTWLELVLETDPNDADSDDDGVVDGDEPAYDQDSDDDGIINALDPDSDNDGLFDGTELGLDCSNPDTDASAAACIADADGGATTTDPLNPDTDGGGVIDGQEDANHDGAVDAGESDPNSADDDAPPDSDGDGVPDDQDNCPSDANPDQANVDDDAPGDACDPDDDNDGFDDQVNVSGGSINCNAGSSAGDLPGGGGLALALCAAAFIARRRGVR
ncbi:MAG: tandem-95 repeat protein [Myxococcales bacterium]|nr:tandem-95 repeat protein [Myxococcales bacterium]